MKKLTITRPNRKVQDNASTSPASQVQQTTTSTTSTASTTASNPTTKTSQKPTGKETNCRNDSKPPRASSPTTATASQPTLPTTAQQERPHSEEKPREKKQQRGETAEGRQSTKKDQQPRRRRQRAQKQQQQQDGKTVTKVEIHKKREPTVLQPSGEPGVGLLFVKGVPYRCHIVKDSNVKVVSTRYLERIRATEEGIASECMPGGCECVSDDEENTASTNESMDAGNDPEKDCYSYEIKDVPSVLIGFVADSQKEIEAETKTKLFLELNSSSSNSNNNGSGRITIQSYESQERVKDAYDRITLIFMRSRSRVDYTHFLNIPLCNDTEFRRRLDSFHTAVRAKHYPGLCDDDSDGGSTAAAVKGPQMHLTIQMLRLLSEAETKKTSRILSRCASSFVTQEMSGKVLRLRGLEYMNDDPSAVNVLYAKVCDFPVVIRDLCSKIVKEFVAAGLVPEDEVRSQSGEEEEDEEDANESEDYVVRFKLHATVFNTRFRKSADAGGRKPFDARQLLKDFGDFDFGTVKIEGIHLSQRLISPSTGYFNCLGSIQFK